MQMYELHERNKKIQGKLNIIIKETTWLYFIALALTSTPTSAIDSCLAQEIPLIPILDDELEE